EDAGKVGIGEGGEDGRHAGQELAVRPGALGCGRPTANDGERFGQPAEAPLGFREQSGRADSARAGEEEGGRVTLGRAIEGKGQTRQLALSPDESRARERDGHVAFYEQPAS